jgi:hypothetical protein
VLGNSRIEWEVGLELRRAGVVVDVARAEVALAARRSVIDCVAGAKGARAGAALPRAWNAPHASVRLDGKEVLAEVTREDQRAMSAQHHVYLSQSTALAKV